MDQSTGTGTVIFSLLIIFGTDVLVLVLVQFSSTDTVLVLIALGPKRSFVQSLLDPGTFHPDSKSF
jgi:hypothetical protein